MTHSLTKLDRYFYLIKVVVNNFEDKLSKKKKSNREEKIREVGYSKMRVLVLII